MLVLFSWTWIPFATTYWAAVPLKQLFFALQVISKEEEEVGDTTAGVITDEGGYVIRVMRLPHKVALARAPA